MTSSCCRVPSEGFYIFQKSNCFLLLLDSLRWDLLNNFMRSFIVFQILGKVPNDREMAYMWFHLLMRIQARLGISHILLSVPFQDTICIMEKMLFCSHAGCCARGSIVNIQWWFVYSQANSSVFCNPSKVVSGVYQSRYLRYVHVNFFTLLMNLIFARMRD